jgi:hypothetical protein
MRTWRRVRKLRAEMPDLPLEAEALLRRLARVQTILDAAFGELEVHGVTTASGEERRLLSEVRRWTDQEQALLRELRTLAAGTRGDGGDWSDLIAKLQREAR